MKPIPNRSFLGLLTRLGRGGTGEEATPSGSEYDSVMATARQRGIRAVIVAASIVVVAVVLSALLGSIVDTNLGAQLNSERLRRDETMAWIARGLLFLDFAWVAIGILATRTSLVRRPGAAATRASWLTSTRPWRARESMLGLLPFDRALLVIVPACLLIGTGGVMLAFMLPWPILLVLLAYVLFLFTAIMMVSPRSPWPAIATMGGVVMGQCALLLIGASWGGPLAFWIALWTNSALRIVVIALALALIVWMVVAVGGAVNSQSSPGYATGIAMIASGVAIAVPCIVAGIIGTDRIDRDWQDPIVRLALPPSAVWILAALGVIMIIVGAIARQRSRSRARAR